MAVFVYSYILSFRAPPRNSITLHDRLDSGEVIPVNLKDMTVHKSLIDLRMVLKCYSA